MERRALRALGRSPIHLGADAAPVSLDHLMTVVRADPALRRCDRIAMALALVDDGFSARDVARIASVRKGVIAPIRRALGLATPPQGAASTNRHHPDLYPSPRSLRVAVQSLRYLPVSAVRAMAHRVGISELAAYAIWRAIDYGLTAEASPAADHGYRCVYCEQRTPTHPCAHCGRSWLRRDAMR